MGYWHTPVSWEIATGTNCISVIIIYDTLFVYRHGANRDKKDSSDYTPLDYAKQSDHMDCARILQTYSLCRFDSKISMASQASINSFKRPSLDKHGHVVFKKVGRYFSFSGKRSSVLPIICIPADSQVQVVCANSDDKQSIIGVEQQVKTSKGSGVMEQEVSFRKVSVTLTLSWM